MSASNNDKGMRTFCNISGLSKEDQDIMARTSKFVLPLLPELTERFYTVLQSDPQTAPYLEERIDLLKKTHIVWMRDLFSGDYGEEFIKRQEKIGEMHVKVRVPPLFVSASMSFLRTALPHLVMDSVPDAHDAVKAVASLLRILDLCQYLIDRNYNAALMDNLGISPALLVRLQTVGKRSVSREPRASEVSLGCKS